MTEERNKYFFNSSAALELAKKQTRITTNNQNVDALQVCYYDGEPLINAPQNCINVPIGNFYNYFLMTKNRLPEQIDFTGMSFSDDVKAQLIEAVTLSLKNIAIERKNIAEALVVETKAYKPDFSHGPRVFLIASRQTTVMQYASKNVASAFKELGCEVFVSIEENDMQELAPFIHLANFLAFKPNITFNINHLNNTHLPEEIFNFIWFQDSMPIVLNDEPIQVRKLDYVYALIPGIQSILQEKGVEVKIQNFFIDHHIYQIYPKIVRKNKIVFIGSSYLSQVPENASIELINEMTRHYIDNGEFANSYMEGLAEIYKLPFTSIFQGVLPYIIRDITLLELSKMDMQYELEIYGWGWEKYDQLKPFYKGVLTHGKAIADIYNTAQYALVTHPNYIVQQRTLESTACGATALVYDCRYRPEVTEPFYEDELLFFQNIKSLQELLNQPYKTKKSDKLLNNHSSLKFAQSLIEIVNGTLEN